MRSYSNCPNESKIKSLKNIETEHQMEQGTIMHLGQGVECGKCKKFIQIVRNYETFK